jgi:hypothetical protein
VAALTPLSVDGVIVAGSTTLLADSRAGRVAAHYLIGHLIWWSGAGSNRRPSAFQAQFVGRILSLTVA